jgi:hypothetical protein
MRQQAFQLTEKGSFRRLLKYCRPSLHDKDIPNRKVVRREIIDRAKQAEMKVREKWSVGKSVSTRLLYFDPFY